VISNLLVVLGLALIVAAAFTLALWLGLAAAGVVVAFLGFAIADGKGL
jgi:hypothetical protein